MSYEALFPEGTLVEIVSREELERFRDQWRLHHKLEPEQLACAGKSGRVSSVGYYHGGDVLYLVEGIPGIWHECCLNASKAN